MKNSNSRIFDREFMDGGNKQINTMNLLRREMETFSGDRYQNKEDSFRMVPHHMLLIVVFFYENIERGIVC